MSLDAINVKVNVQKSVSRHGSTGSLRSSNSLESSSSESSYSSIPPSPDGGYGWIIVLAAFSIHFICDGIAFSFGIMFSELLEYFGESKSFTSWIGSLFYGTCLMGGPLASALATKFGCRKVLMAGGLFAATSTFISAYATSVSFLCVSFGICTGLGMSMGYVTALVMVAFYFEDRRALATGLSVSGSGIGTFVFAPLSEYLIRVYGWRGTMITLSGIMLNLCVCGALLKPLEFTPHQRKLRLLHKFDKLSRSVSYASFALSKNTSRHTSHTEGLEKDHNPFPEENLENCASQIEIPTFIKENNIEIPIEILNEARTNSTVLQDYFKQMVAEKQMLDSYHNEMESPDVDNFNDKARAGNLAYGVIPEDVMDPSDIFSACNNYAVNNNDSDNNESKNVQNGKIVETMDFENEAETKFLNVHTPDESKPTEIKPKASCLKKSSNKTTGHKHHGKPRKQVTMSSYLPLYRTGLFFRGNLSRLQRIDGLRGRVRSTSCPELTARRWDDEEESSDDEDEFFIWKYLHFSKDMKRVFKTLFDPSIFRSPLYVVYAISNFLLYFWYDVPYMFVADRAKELGMTETNAAFLISVLGIVNTFGQIAYGFIGDLNVNLSVLYGFSIIACGVTVLLVPLFYTFTPLAILSGGFGLLISANYTLSTVILVEFLGLRRLANAYGLTMLVQGIGNLIGPPIAASFRDATHSYDTTFFAAGGFIVLSGCLLLGMPIVRRIRSRIGASSFGSLRAGSVEKSVAYEIEIVPVSGKELPTYELIQTMPAPKLTQETGV